jgi:hypothetical protein
MRALVLLFASSLALASAHAGEMAKQGSDSSTIYYVTIAPNEYAGVKRTDSADAMFDRMAVRSTHHGGGHGDVVMMDADGDQIFATWEFSGPADDGRELGVWHWARGTGKYAGISGEGVWTCNLLRTPDGTEMSICPHKISWKLPKGLASAPDAEADKATRV